MQDIWFKFFKISNVMYLKVQIDSNIKEICKPVMLCLLTTQAKRAPAKRAPAKKAPAY